jgi:predicted nucleic acid-binding protein
MIILDTNVLSELMKSAPEHRVLEWLDTIPPSECYISAITKAEIELGIALLSDGKRKINLEAAAKLMFNEFPDRCLSFNSVSASNYAVIVAERTRVGRPISVEDAQIAAIALTHDFSLATRNTSDFEFIDGLIFINPWLAPCPPAFE